MLFTEPVFLFLFLPVLLALYFATFSRNHAAYANWLLLAASVMFYARGGGTFTWLILASIVFNYWMAIAIADATAASGSPGRRPPLRRALLAFTVGTNLLVLAVFKYANFFADNLNVLL